jgi:HPt (histidine-containing phosphotransfer) domain-containing protein
VLSNKKGISMEKKIDLEKLADAFGFDLDEIKMIIETFLKTASENLIDIKHAIENNDLEKLSKAAHSLKGSSSTLQLTEISELAKEIEADAKNGVNIDYKNKFNQLNDLINSLK